MWSSWWNENWSSNNHEREVTDEEFYINNNAGTEPGNKLNLTATN
jgi:hypothetical protein